MPVDDLYWNSIDFGSEESIHDLPSSKHYVDPWDLENYAYIRDHLDSNDANSNRSSSEEFTAEANSNSFYYVPAQKEQNYAAVDEIKRYNYGRDRPTRERYVYSDSGLPRVSGRDNSFDSDIEENPYEENLKDNSLFYTHDVKDKWNRLEMPSIATKTPRDRSISFSYGDFGRESYMEQRDIYCRVDEVQTRKDSTLPIYDDVRRRKPRNFGLSNYGHLKIDYSYSWNNLNKYIAN